jgi:hypothetical protein
MATGYSRSPKLLKGALIHFSAPLLIPIPNIIVFQYNPETMTREMKPWTPPSTAEEAEKRREDAEAGLAQPYDPEESFSLTLELDAADALEFPASHPVAVATGVADRIAALEMLLYPPGDSALGGLLNVSVDITIDPSGTSVLSGPKADIVKRKSVPVVLFFWGPGRIVPVRVTTFAVEEQAFSPILYPLRAKATIGLKVLGEHAFAGQTQTATIKIAKAAYKFTRVQKELLATANLANSAESIVSMLPL